MKNINHIDINIVLDHSGSMEIVRKGAVQEYRKYQAARQDSESLSRLGYT